METNTIPAEGAQYQPVKYRDLISRSEEALQLEQLELNVQVAKSELEVSISQTKLDLSLAKQKLENSKRAIPYSIQCELVAFKEVESLELGLEYAERVLKERF
jgi:hypothetical protein